MGAFKNAKKTINEVKKTLDHNSPTILTCLAVAGLIATGITAYRMASTADEIIARKKKELDETEPNETEKKKEIVIQAAKELAPVVLPTVLMGSATAACIIGSNHASKKKIAVLSTAYTLSEKTVKSLNEKMVEVVGEKKTSDIKDAIIKDTIGAAPEELANANKEEIDPKVVSANTPMARDVLCKDIYSGRFFWSTYEKIQIAINRLSSDCQTEMWIGLNDLYSEPEINLENVPMGDDLGWNVDDLDRGQLPIEIRALLTDDGYPCLCLDYDVGVRMDLKGMM